MLSVSTIKSAGKAGAYYTSEDNYYFLGEQSTEWYGTGAENLGLEGPVKAALGQEEKEPEPVAHDDTRTAPDDRESEREAALAAALEALQDQEAIDYRDYDLSPEREERAAMMNDEVNVMRHERSEPEPEFGHKPQKTME